MCRNTQTVYFGILYGLAQGESQTIRFCFAFRVSVWMSSSAGRMRKTVRSNKVLVIKAIWYHKPVLCEQLPDGISEALMRARGFLFIQHRHTQITRDASECSTKEWNFCLLSSGCDEQHNLVYGVCAFLIIHSVLLDNTLFLQANVCSHVYITIRDVTFPI